MKNQNNLKNFFISFFSVVFLSLFLNVFAENINESFYLPLLKKIAGKSQNFLAKAPLPTTTPVIKEKEPLKEETVFLANLANPELSAKSALSIVFNKESGEKILFSKNSREQLPIASLTKLMTAYAVFDLKETYNPSQIITISEIIPKKEQTQENKLAIGDKLSVQDILSAALIESSNDAALALTSTIGEKGFVELMNLYAENLGMENTNYINPTGLDHKDGSNLSTAEDLARLAESIIKNHPQIFEITLNKTLQIEKIGSDPKEYIYLTNTNELLWEISDIVGGKTGETPASLQCFLLALKNPENNEFFIGVVLGSEDRFNDMKKLLGTLSLN